MNFEQVKKYIESSNSVKEFDKKFATFKNSELTLNPTDIVTYGIEVLNETIENSGKYETEYLKVIRSRLEDIQNVGDKLPTQKQLTELLISINKFLNCKIDKLLDIDQIKESSIALYGMLRSLQYCLSKDKDELARQVGFDLTTLREQMDTLAEKIGGFVKKIDVAIEARNETNKALRP